MVYIPQKKVQHIFANEPQFSSEFHLAVNELLIALDTFFDNMDVNYCTNSSISASTCPSESPHILQDQYLRQEATYKKVLVIIDKNLNNPKLCPRWAAAQSFLSVSHLHKLFKNHNTSFNKEVKLRRLHKVVTLLTAPESKHISIGLIASQCGFFDQCYFNRVFRATYRLTPTEYYAQHLVRAENP